MDKITIGHLHNETPLSHLKKEKEKEGEGEEEKKKKEEEEEKEKEENFTHCDSMCGTGEHYAK